MSKNRAQFLVIAILAVSAGLFVVFHFYFKEDTQGPTPNKLVDPEGIVDGIHVKTGLKEGEGLLTVVTHCTACHSAEIIIQNRMDKERWNATIRWMQETQNLWDLGDKQEVIVSYLVNNYPVVKKGRRENLSDIQWYELNQ